MMKLIPQDKTHSPTSRQKISWNFVLKSLTITLYKFVRVKYTYKFRLYPNKEQHILLAKHFGCSRFLYNHFLARRTKEYLTTGRSNNFVRDCKELTELKKEVVWLKEVNSQSLQQAIKNLDAAYGNFFEKRAKFPKFKNKHDKQSFRVPQNIKLVGDRLVIPKFLEGIKCKVHRPVNKEISFATITKNKSGQYYCTLMVEKEVEQHKKTKKSALILGSRLWQWTAMARNTRTFDHSNH